MHEKPVAEMQAELDRLSNLRSETVDALQALKDDAGNQINLSNLIPSTERSYFNLDALVSTIVRFGKAIDLNQNWEFVPGAWLANYIEAIRNTGNNFDNLKKNITSINEQHGGISQVDSGNFVVKTKSGTDVDLLTPLKNINVNSEKIFEHYYTLRQAIGAPRLTEFGDLFRIFSARREELDDTSKKLSTIIEEASKIEKAIVADATSTKTSRSEIDRLKEEITKDRKTTLEYSNEASQKVEQIRAIDGAAAQLQTSVSSYQKNFDKFQKEIEERNSAYETLKNNFDRLIAGLQDKEKDMERLHSLSEAMLKGATNAGLSTSFSDKQSEVDGELKKARISYNWSIALLVFLTLPVFLYSLPRELVVAIWSKLVPFDITNIIGKEAPKTDYEHLTAFLGRALLLIPGFLFVRFNSLRHDRLFKLREQYMYKKSIAMSVEGFKAQAKDYADEIAAASYYELTQNPANIMDSSTSKDARMPNPVWEWLLKKIEGKRAK